MDIEELKLRRVTNQFLAEKGEKLEVASALNGFQAQFMTNALHSMKLRCRDFSLETAPDGLVKNWTIRGTVHVFAERDLLLYKHDREKYRSLEFEPHYTWQHPDGSCIWYDDGNCQKVPTLLPERQQYLSLVILDSLAKGEKTRDELKALCRDAGMTEFEECVMFDQWGGGIRDLCERGFMNFTVEEKKAYRLCEPFEPLDTDAAELEIARRYFTNFAPATIRDAAYYLGISQTRVKALLERLPVSTCECGGKTLFFIENGRKYDKPMPECLFLAGFDQLMLGYEKKESVFLAPEHLRGIFNLAGIVMPAILLRGNVVGRWRKKGRKLELTLFEPLSEGDRKKLADAELWDDISKIEWK